MRISTRYITVMAVMVALTAAMGYIPYVFFLPVMVAATLLGFYGALIIGTAFGFISLMYSFFFPVSIVAAAFVQAPWLPVVPRIFAAVGAWALYVLFDKLIKNQDTNIKKALPISLAAAAGSLLNTVLVVGCMLIFMPDFALGDETLYVYTPAMLISGAIEFVALAVLVPPVVLTLRRMPVMAALYRDKRSKTEANDISS